MFMNMHIFFAIVLSYLLGSVPVGYIICRVTKSIDVRTQGSGNVGATNVTRLAGKIPGITTLILDILKGLAAVTLIPMLLGPATDTLRVSCAIGVVAGHNWTIFLRFKGGKGVATSAGVFLGLMPLVFLSCLCVWATAFITWRYVSLASVLTAISLPVFTTLYQKSPLYILLGCIVALLGLMRHKDNIKRLFKGKEGKIRI